MKALLSILLLFAMTNTTTAVPDSLKKKSEVDLVSITLEVESEAWLFILLARDGTINRMGDGANSPKKESVYIGITEEKLFEAFMENVDEQMLSHPGAYDHKEKEGKACSVKIIFSDQNEEKKSGFYFGYGSDSAGPPQPIPSLIMKAIEITDPWHQEQKNKE
ncbi:hypothetical protein [Coraliomargarita parva]|uniref:hypothetical protein n=1 Tax=Coraliomargarita parva TaxID=3014050 RepID=UPI0022B416B6|nr:hypothetical protein [Coraliomargarita parva]